MDATIAVVPEIRRFLEDTKRLRENPPKSRNSLIAGSILASAVFVGSTVLYTSNTSMGEIGMVGSAVIMGITVALKGH